MKNLTKIAGVMLALFLALCFVSCKNGPTEVASFKGTVQGQEITISFYDDATISWGMNGASVGGTYTGDVSKDGKGTFKVERDGVSVDHDWKLEGDKLTYGKEVMGVFVKIATLTRI